MSTILVAPPTVTPVGSVIQWSYDASVARPATIGNASLTCLSVPSGGTCQALITIYDFAGFVSGSNFQPAGWSFSTSNLGDTPLNTFPNFDDPAIQNLTWKYTGASALVFTGSSGTAPLGSFGAQSIYSFAVEDDYAYRDAFGSIAPTSTPTNLRRRRVAGIGSTDVPAPTPVPEPSAWVLMATGLGLALWRKVRA